MEVDPFNNVKWDWTEDPNVAPPFPKDINGELLSTGLWRVVRKSSALPFESKDVIIHALKGDTKS
jgi:hypothetical protein